MSFLRCMLWFLHHVLWFCHSVMCFVFTYHHFRCQALVPSLHTPRQIASGDSSCVIYRGMILHNPEPIEEPVMEKILRELKLKSPFPKFAAQPSEPENVSALSDEELSCLGVYDWGSSLCSWPLCKPWKRSSFCGCKCS